MISGNAGSNANNYSPGRANHPNIWTVSAYDDQDVFASFSNFGNPPIEYSGPGVDIPSLWKNGGTNTISGTSMAAPHIAGLLLIEGNNLYVDGTVTGDADSNPDEIATFAPPFSTTISGSVFLSSGQQGSWSTQNSFAPGAPYTYTWYYRNANNAPWIQGSSYTSSFNHTFYNSTGSLMKAGVKVVVNSQSETTEDYFNVSVFSSGGGGF